MSNPEGKTVHKIDFCLSLEGGEDLTYATRTLWLQPIVTNFIQHFPASESDGKDRPEQELEFRLRATEEPESVKTVEEAFLDVPAGLPEPTRVFVDGEMDFFADEHMERWESQRARAYSFWLLDDDDEDVSAASLMGVIEFFDAPIPHEPAHGKKD